MRGEDNKVDNVKKVIIVNNETINVQGEEKMKGEKCKQEVEVIINV